MSELMLRNAQRLKGARILLINPPRDSAFSQLEEDGCKVRIFTQDFGDYQWLLACGAHAEFGVIPDIDPETEHIVLVQPRERDRLMMMLHAITSAMPGTARLWLAGEIRTGIKSAGKHLAHFFDSVNKIDNARHCVLFEAANARPESPFHLADYALKWPMPAPWDDIEIVSLPGTFAHGKLDQGSKLLLEAIRELTPDGRILDFACGNGVIGLVLMKLCPESELSLLDTSALALESASLTLRANGSQAALLPSDGLAGAGGRYDWIVSNPPFHSGIANDLDIARKFFNEAGNFLEESGKMLIVFNHHLPYQGWLKESFRRVETIRASNEFKVVQAGGAHL